ncbi:MAG: NFACT family protein [Thermoplasmata archaeon]|nr:MAG: NFACT family protein [Thermoplasmata archaeon]
MKKQNSGFDIFRLVLDMQNLVGAYFEKAYQLSSNELVLRFNIPKGGKSELYINLSGYIYLTSEPKDKPNQPKTFAMVLRKHLRNARVVGIEQYEFDRIMVIKLSKDRNYRLVMELFGEGNALLIEDSESDNKIINAHYHRSWSARTLRPGRSYNFPPARTNPRTTALEDMLKIFKDTRRDLVRTLAIDLNLGGLYAEEVCKRVVMDKALKAASMEKSQIESIYKTIQALFEEVEQRPETLIVYEDTELIDVVPIKLNIYDTNKTEPVPNLSAGLEKYFLSFEASAAESVSDAVKTVMDKKAGLERQYKQQQEAIEKFKSASEKNRRLADLIYQNYKLCEGVLNKIAALREKYDWDEIQDEELLDIDEVTELNPHEGSVKLQLEGSDTEGAVGEEKVKLQLDFRLNVNQNAERYYERAKQSKEKHAGAVAALESTKEALKNIEEDLERSLEQAPEEDGSAKGAMIRRKTLWFERFRWFISSDELLTVAGHDASSNDRVVKKYLRSGDRYVHADLHGAPSVVVRRQEGDDDSPIPETTLNEACIFAVVHSKAWNSKVGAASAYWVNAEQVSRTPGTGEFLPKGAFMVRGKRNYVTGIELKAAVGEIEYEGTPLVMCGPESAVNFRTNRYITLRPGKTKKTTMAKKLKAIFQCSMDELMKIMPPGDVDIVEAVGIEIETD